jgi:predicted RNA-binding Zn-ribbon protein involved in translation (DUF1610 family)
MASNRTKTALTVLECPECGFLWEIPRKKSKQKKAGHVKHMHCPGCNIVQGFIEKRDE